jgi:hypothetical protein
MSVQQIKHARGRLKTRKVFVFSYEEVVRPARVELATFWFVARRSIQLSYGRAIERKKLNPAPLSPVLITLHARTGNVRAKLVRTARTEKIIEQLALFVHCVQHCEI